MYLKNTAILIRYQNATRFHNSTAPRNTKKNVTKRPFQNATMYLKNTAILIRYRNATRFHNSTAPRNTKKNVRRFPSQFQLKRRNEFVYGQIKDMVMMMTIVKPYFKYL